VVDGETRTLSTNPDRHASAERDPGRHQSPIGFRLSPKNDRRKDGRFTRYWCGAEEVDIASWPQLPTRSANESRLPGCWAAKPVAISLTNLGMKRRQHPPHFRRASRGLMDWFLLTGRPAAAIDDAVRAIEEVAAFTAVGGT